MTCVVGMLDKENKTVYLGGDSLGSNSYTKTIYKQRKVFHSKDTNDLIIGICGSFNFQGLEYEKLLDETKLLKGEIDREYLITKFIPNLRRIISSYNCNESKSGIDSMEGVLLFGYKDNLFMIQSDYSLVESTDGYLSIGSGMDYALGSLATTYNDEIPIVDKIHMALKSATKHAVGVEPPFYIINTSNDEVIELLK